MKENNVKMEVMYDISDRIKEIKNFARDNDNKISLFKHCIGAIKV